MKENHLVFAEAILKSKSGQSLLTSDNLITSENIDRFYPSEETITEARKAFNVLGFSTPQSGVTLTIVGTKSTFETVFKSEIVETQDKNSGRKSIGFRNEPAMPPSLMKTIERIVFIPPPVYHF